MSDDKITRFQDRLVADGPRSTTGALAITNLRWIRKGHLLASFDVEVLRWRLQLCGCTWHRWDTGYEKINFPAREWSDRDGKKQYANVVKFTDEAVGQRFQDAVLAELHELE